MKNLNLILIFLLLFASCKKELNNEINLKSSQTSKFIEIVKFNSFEERKVSFQLLNNIEKADFWKYQISEFITKTNDSKKINLLEELALNFTPSIYDDSSKEHEIFVSIKLPDWMERAKSVFKGPEIFNTFYILQKEKIQQDTLSNNNDKAIVVKTKENIAMRYALADCMCNLSSNFTCPKTTTHMGTDGVWQETTYGSCSNQGNGCKEDNWGCGFGGLFYCNGNKCTY